MKDRSYCEYDFSKHKDTKGGFLAVEQESEKLEPISGICDCGSIDINPKFHRYFGIMKCFKCSKTMHLITKTESIKDYLLKESELPLKFMPKENKHNKFTSMKLYLREQVEEIALKKWDTWETLDAELDKRDLKHKEQKDKKYKKQLQELRKKTIIKNLIKEDHKHEFAVVNNKKICECGFELEFEEICI